MSVIFLADNGKETLEFPAQEGENGTFTGEAACTLTDTITLSAVFVTGDTRQTQLLDQYVDLYSDSLPQIDVNSLLSIFEVEEYDQGDGSFVIPEEYVTVSDGQNGSSVSAVWEQLGVSQLRKVEVGLFYNEKLVQWLTPCQKPSNYKGFEDEDFYRLDPVTLSMEEGDMLEIAARGTDQYGRQCGRGLCIAEAEHQLPFDPAHAVYLLRKPRCDPFSHECDGYHHRSHLECITLPEDDTEVYHHAHPYKEVGDKQSIADKFKVSHQR